MAIVTSPKYWVLDIPLPNVLNKDDFDRCDHITYLQAQRSRELSAQKQDRKYEALLRAQKSNKILEPNSLSSNTVINLSDKVLTEPAVEALKKGINFVPTPSRIPFEKIIGKIEDTIRSNHIPPSDADELRQDVAVVLRQSKPPTSNISQQEIAAIKDLRNDDSIYVLKADKGNATVVLNTSEYDGKLKALLSDEKTYKPVDYNPTARVTRKTIDLVKECSESIPKEGYNPNGWADLDM
ncbi:hypothetical protein NE865_06474 [Phthorimaea operculella]|nr:hypothetical protein NE865_06474 [Phthorimaea operculella]